MNTKTLKYIQQEHSREQNTYIEEFYSSPDVKIEINGEEFKEASSVNYSMQEQLKPLYSYNSAVFDDVAVGNRIVVGSITVPIHNIDNNDKVDSDVEVVEEVFFDRPGWAMNYETGSSPYFTDGGSRSDTGIITGIGSVVNAPMGFNFDIKKAQEVLLGQNYDVIVNGYLDIKTRKALIKYQELNGLKITGVLDPETKAHLFNESKDGNATTTVNCYVYAGPDTTLTPISPVLAGTKLEVISQINNFTYAKVLSSNEKLGYIESIYIKMLQ